MKTYTGGCHCGLVRYEVSMELKDVLECNCSHCQIKGFLLAFVPDDNFTLLSGEDALTCYQFNKKHIDHLFCHHCGVQAFGRGAKDGKKIVAVNVRSIDNIDLSSLTRIPVDGRKW